MHRRSRSNSALSEYDEHVKRSHSDVDFILDTSDDIVVVYTGDVQDEFDGLHEHDTLQGQLREHVDHEKRVIHRLPIEHEFGVKSLSDLNFGTNDRGGFKMNDGFRVWRGWGEEGRTVERSGLREARVCHGIFNDLRTKIEV
jgi:hypothetical protein